MKKRILIWDFPTRIFHWLQLIAFSSAYLTSDSERYRDIHVAMGYIMLGLLVFRLLWGVIGTPYARFNSFWFRPGEIANYLLSLVKRSTRHYVGHNPLGSVAVWLLLGNGLFICITGVMALQDDASDTIVSLHGIATNIMLVLIALHLAGVVLSSIMHRENLVLSMITGYKFDADQPGIKSNFIWLGIIMLLIILIFWYVFMHFNG